MRSSFLALAIVGAALAFAPCLLASTTPAPVAPRVIPVNLGKTLQPTPATVAFAKKYPVTVNLGHRRVVATMFSPRAVPVSLQKR